MKFKITLKGGSGSGNFDHAGIPGHQGGSATGIASPKDILAKYPKQLRDDLYIRTEDMGSSTSNVVDLIQASVDTVDIYHDNLDSHDKVELRNYRTIAKQAAKFLAELYAANITSGDNWLDKQYIAIATGRNKV